MTFDDALPLLKEGKALYSEFMGVTMFCRHKDDRLTFVPRQRNHRRMQLSDAEWAHSAAMTGDWVLSGIEPQGASA
jgi:hypothetical protein